VLPVILQAVYINTLKPPEMTALLFFVAATVDIPRASHDVDFYYVFLTINIKNNAP